MTWLSLSCRPQKVLIHCMNQTLIKYLQNLFHIISNTKYEQTQININSNPMWNISQTSKITLFNNQFQIEMHLFLLSFLWIQFNFIFRGFWFKNKLKCVVSFKIILSKSFKNPLKSSLKISFPHLSSKLI